MTQLSNVPMQPKSDAVERPLTLVEKLENYRDTQTDFEAMFADAVMSRDSQYIDQTFLLVMVGSVV